MRTSLFGAVLVLACLVTPTVTDAQEQPQLSVDVSVGAAHRTDLFYASDAGFVLDALGALRLNSVLGGNLVAAASVGMDGFPSLGDRCRIDPPYDAPGPPVCRPDFSYSRVALLGGWQYGGTWMFRALAGPAYYGEFLSSSPATTARGAAAAAGADGRIDLGGPLFGHLGFSLTARAATLPNIRGRSVNIVAGTLGFRIH
jgi:hypothetical protein